jgi:hypothetical protein
VPDERNDLGPDRGVAVFVSHAAERGSVAWRRPLRAGTRIRHVPRGAYGPEDAVRLVLEDA